MMMFFGEVPLVELLEWSFMVFALLVILRV